MSSAADPATPGSEPPSPVRGRRVLVGVSGGIAVYKTATLVSRLAQRGGEVRVLMTEAATRFVTPLTFQSLSGHKVLTSIWETDDRPDAQHIGLARWADLLILAPATANLIAKVAAGLCDDVVSLAAASLPRDPQPTPVLLAPAMNADMWQSPITTRNIDTLRSLDGWHIIGPEEGWQACRTTGPGRMSEPDTLLEAVDKILAR